MRKALVIFGTRPEAIKLAPVIKELEKQKINPVICVTAQHREMLDQVLDIFKIHPDYDLNIMAKRQSLSGIASKAIIEIEKVIKKENPDLIIVQGDTSSAFISGLVAFYHKIRIAHVEAGLRTDNKHNPFPEEINRRLLSHLADLHFAPTQKAKENLVKEMIGKSKIFVTGNTVIDALLWVKGKVKSYKNKKLNDSSFSNKKVILLTTHRRENLDGGMDNIFQALNLITSEHPEVFIIFPVHLNPLVQKLAKKYFSDNSQVALIEPLSYTDLVKLMNDSYLIMTDSGGIQEEAPSLGKPVIVLRETTERPEGIEAGTAILAGLETKRIFQLTDKLLISESEYRRMSKIKNPYGIGNASKKIVKVLRKELI